MVGDQFDKKRRGGRQKICVGVKSYLFIVQLGPYLSPKAFGPKRNSKMPFDHHHHPPTTHT